MSLERVAGNGIALDLDAELAELTEDPGGPRVAAIGGGHGLAMALRAARCFAGDVKAVVSVADDGGSSGRLTEGLGIPPPGDIRRCLLALTPDVSIWTELFDYRFDPQRPDILGVEGHSLGNLIIAALTSLRGDFAEAVEEAGRLLGVMGRVIPAADHPVSLSAIVGGRMVSGQVAVARSKGPVEQLFLGPDVVTARPEAIRAIREADQIIIGPGSLFTSTIAALLVPGITEAIASSGGRLVFVLNLVTQDGETLGLTGIRHLEALISHAGLEKGGVIVAHSEPMTPPEGHDAVEIADADAAGHGWAVIRADVMDQSADWPCHDPTKLAGVLANL